MDQGRPAVEPVRARPGPQGDPSWPGKGGPEVPRRDAVPDPAWVHAVDELPVGQPVWPFQWTESGCLLALSVPLDRRDRLARPPPRRLTAAARVKRGSALGIVVAAPAPEVRVSACSVSDHDGRRETGMTTRPSLISSRILRLPRAVSPASGSCRSASSPAWPSPYSPREDPAATRPEATVRTAPTIAVADLLQRVSRPLRHDEASSASSSLRR